MDFILNEIENAKSTVKELDLMRFEARVVFKMISEKVEPNPRSKKEKERNKMLICLNAKLLSYITAIDELKSALIHFLNGDLDDVSALKLINKKKEKLIKAHEKVEDEVDKRIEEREAKENGK